MIEFRGDRFVWRQVADTLRGRIETGIYRSGERMPSETDIVQEFGIARTTARKVIAHLREAGLIYTVPYLGSFVGTDPGPDA